MIPSSWEGRFRWDREGEAWVVTVDNGRGDELTYRRHRDLLVAVSDALADVSWARVATVDVQQELL